MHLRSNVKMSENVHQYTMPCKTFLSLRKKYLIPPQCHLNKLLICSIEIIDLFQKCRGTWISFPHSINNTYSRKETICFWVRG